MLWQASSHVIAESVSSFWSYSVINTLVKKLPREQHEKGACSYHPVDVLLCDREECCLLHLSIIFLLKGSWSALRAPGTFDHCLWWMPDFAYLLKLKRWRRSLHTAYNIHRLCAYSHLTTSQSGLTATCNYSNFVILKFLTSLSYASWIRVLEKKKVLDQHDFRVHSHYAPHCLSQEDQRFLSS